MIVNVSAGHEAGSRRECPVLVTRSSTITGSLAPSEVGPLPAGRFSGYALEPLRRDKSLIQIDASQALDKPAPRCAAQRPAQ